MEITLGSSIFFFFSSIEAGFARVPAHARACLLHPSESFPTPYCLPKSAQYPRCNGVHAPSPLSLPPFTETSLAGRLAATAIRWHIDAKRTVVAPSLKHARGKRLQATQKARKPPLCRVNRKNRPTTRAGVAVNHTSGSFRPDKPYSTYSGFQASVWFRLKF